jgi:hypothetical protein
MKKGIAPLVAVAIIAAIGLATFAGLGYLSKQNPDVAKTLGTIKDTLTGAGKTPAASATPTGAQPGTSTGGTPSGTEGGTAGGCLKIDLPLGTVVNAYHLSIPINTIDNLRYSYSADFYVTNGCANEITIDFLNVPIPGKVESFTKEGQGNSISAGDSARIQLTDDKPNIRDIYRGVGRSFIIGRPGIATEQYTITAIPKLTLETAKLKLGESVTYGPYKMWFVDVWKGYERPVARFNVTRADSKSPSENVIEWETGTGEGDISTSGKTGLRIAVFEVNPGSASVLVTPENPSIAGTDASAVIAVDVDCAVNAEIPTKTLPKCAALQDTLSLEIVRQMAFTFTDGKSITTDAIKKIGRASCRERVS